MSAGIIAASYVEAAITNYRDLVLADAPLAYYRLNEASGTTMSDSSGNGHHGTYTGSPTLGSAGLLTHDSDTAVTFAAGKFGSVPYAAWMDAAFLTLEALIKPSSISVTGNIIDRDVNSGARTYQFRVAATGRLDFTFWTSSGGPFAVTSADNVLAAGVTAHVAATWDGANARIYVNGSQVGTLAQAGTSMRTGGTLISVGTHAGVNSQSFAGVIDEAAIYPAALSAATIAAHAAAM